MKADRPSATARVVAAAVLIATYRKRAVKPSPDTVKMARNVFGSTRRDRLFLRTIDSRIGRVFWSIFERLTIPGFVRHIAGRKAWINHVCERSVERGFTRVVILGAGFDAIGPRLAAAHPAAQVIELDHPSTQRAKTAAVGPDSTHKNLFLLPVDLEHQRITTLLAEQAPPHSPDVPTLVLAEGLLMYLTPEQVDRLMDDVAALTSGPLRFVFTFMSAATLDRINFGRGRSPISAWLRAVGEPFRWGATRPGVQEMLARRGLRVLAFRGGRRQARPGQDAHGEHFVLAERAPGANSGHEQIPSLTP